MTTKSLRPRRILHHLWELATNWLRNTARKLGLTARQTLALPGVRDQFHVAKRWRRGTPGLCGKCRQILEGYAAWSGINPRPSQKALAAQACRKAALSKEVAA